jgi:murein DD-endopeptidase MepM/ murein hydrolase activator NlpD
MKRLYSIRNVTLLLLTTLLTPPVLAQGGDQDFDGVPDSQDPCPRSIASQEQLLPGCSCVDLMLYPEVASDPVLASMKKMEEVLLQRPELFNSAEVLGSARFRMLVGVESIRDAKINEGCESLLAALDDMFVSQAMLNDFIVNLKQELDDDFAGPPGGGPGAGGLLGGPGIGPGSQVSRAGNAQNLQPHRAGYADTDEGTAELLYWTVRAEELLAITFEANEMVNLFTIMRSVSGSPFTLTGQVFNLDDGMHTLQLDDGTEIVLPWEYLASDGFYLGQMIQINGDEVDGKPVAEEMVSVEGGTDPWLDPTTEICLQLRFSPATALMTSGTLKHDPAGYLESGGEYELEQGMAISAEEAGTCGPWPTGGPHNEVTGYHDSFQVKLFYTTKSWAQKSVTLASALTASSQPPFLPADMNPAVTANMVVVRNRQDYIANDFSPFSSISSPYVVGMDLYLLNVRDRGHFALYEYDKLAFTLEDDDVNGFEAAQFTGVTLSPEVNEDSGTLTQRAHGWAIVNGAVQYSTSIGPFQSFAIRNHDFYPVWPSDGPPNAHWTSVTHPAGLEWPTISGERNGKAFRYTSRLPEIVRDAVALCADAGGPTDAHCYYRLPFANGTQTIVTQGNGGAFTHQGGQQFAYDLSGVEGTPLLASRPGIVNSVRSNITVNCQAPGFQGPCPFFGNFVSVVHQDGTEAFYLHMVTDSPVVVQDQEVKRGDTLGLLGNTGNSTGPHVHFHVNGPGTNITIPARFELLQNPLLTLLQCVIPLQGWLVTATN